VPLIIDLRENNGGRGEYAAQLLSLITAKGKKYQPSTWMFRITPMIRQMFETLSIKDRKSGRNQKSRKIFKFINEAVEKKKLHTRLFNRILEISADEEVEGFSEKVVVLSGSECVSTCDIFLSLIKSSRRALVIGGAGNGTGAGAITNKKFDSIEWKDYYKIMKIKIPNSLFGLPQRIPKDYKQDNSSLLLNMENNPIKPDVLYSSTLDDYLQKDLGWYKKAVEVLNKL
jgi:hypothetical protein